MLESLGLPTVVIAPAPIECRWPVVAVDDRPGIAAAVEHLVALGHRRIAHVAGPREFVHSRSRQTAWADTLAASGLEESPCVWSDFSPSGGAHATRELLDLPEPPTAIVYANDLMAIAGTSAAQARGLHVPYDLSVTGFDDTAISGYLRPPLTTVRTDAVAWGSAAAQCLLQLVDGGTCPDVMLPPPELVLRASTAPPQSDSTCHPFGSLDRARPLVPHHQRNGSRMNIKTTTTLGLSLLFALGAAACGSDDDGGGAAARAPPAPRVPSRSGCRTTPRRSPGARRWSTPGTRSTPTRRSPPRRFPPGSRPRR